MLQAEIRRALPCEAANLSALALRSKALWGYDAAFMDACRVPLTVDPEAIAKWPFYVLDEDGTITGFYGLSGRPPRGEIEFLFVDPESVRSGRGQRLAQHFLAMARRPGVRGVSTFRRIPLPRAFMWRWAPGGSPKFHPTPIPNRLVPRLRFSLLDGPCHGTICLTCTTRSCRNAMAKTRPAQERVKELKDGWNRHGASPAFARAGSSRQPRCGFLRMTYFLNAINNVPHGEEGRRRVSNHA